MPRVLEIAIRAAVGKRGVAVLVIPGDVALQPAAARAAAECDGLLPRRAGRHARAETSSTRLAALLNGGKRVTMLCGAGCAGRA